MGSNQRNREWNIVINAEQLPKHKEIEQKFIEIKVENYAYITHDKDKDEKTGEQKRAHIHAFISFKNARSFETLQKQMTGWHLEPVANKIASLQYLTHKNDEEKHQYTIDEVKTNDKEWYKQYYALAAKINDEKLLIKGILEGKYNSMVELIIENEFTMEFINRRYQVIQSLFTYADGVRRKNTVKKSLEKKVATENK